MQRVWFLCLFLVGLIFPIAVAWPQEDYKGMLPPGKVRNWSLNSVTPVIISKKS